MLELTAFQDAFCAALEGQARDLTPWLTSDAQAPGLSVYRNTVVKGSADALAAIYETVVQLVGEDWFRAAAVAYVRAHPPAAPSLLSYGSDFPEWLAGFPPAQDTPYLAEVARLDRLYSEAYFAADAEPLDPVAFAKLDMDDLAGLGAHLHPSVRLATLEQNIVSLWLAHRRPDGELAEFELIDQAEHALVVRTGLEVEVRRLDAAAYAFLKACAGGESLLRCAERALSADPAADFPQIVVAALQVGAFSALANVTRGEQGS